MTIRNIFIDLGGVLVRTDDRGPRDRQAHALGLTSRELEKIVFEAQTAYDASIGAITEQAHFESVAKALGIDQATAGRVTAEFFAGDRVDLSLLDFLRSQRPGHKICLISNAWSGLRAFITRQSFDDVFDKMVISAEVGMIKPDPRIYQIALQLLAARPEESVFVDDVLVNVEAARALGMHGIQFTQPERTLEELKQLLNHNV